MARRKIKHDSQQRILGLGPESWDVLGFVDPYTLVSPKTLFRKVLKPRSPHDFGYYYHKVIVVREWNNIKEGARMGATSFRIKETPKPTVTCVYPAGSCVERENQEGIVYYELAILFQTEGNQDVED